MYVGTAPGPGGETVRVATATEKNVPEYVVTVEVTGKRGEKDVLQFRRPFADWFDGAGRFVAAPFQEMMAGSVPVVGRCDPKRAAKAKGVVAGAGVGEGKYTAEMLDVLAAAQARDSVVGSGGEEATGADVKKGGKRRKA